MDGNGNGLRRAATARGRNNRDHLISRQQPRTPYIVGAVPVYNWFGLLRPACLTPSPEILFEGPVVLSPVVRLGHRLVCTHCHPPIAEPYPPIPRSAFVAHHYHQPCHLLHSRPPRTPRRHGFETPILVDWPPTTVGQGSSTPESDLCGALQLQSQSHS